MPLAQRTLQSSGRAIADGKAEIGPLAVHQIPPHANRPPPGLGEDPGEQLAKKLRPAGGKPAQTARFPA